MPINVKDRYIGGGRAGTIRECGGEGGLFNLYFMGDDLIMAYCEHNLLLPSSQHGKFQQTLPWASSSKIQLPRLPVVSKVLIKPYGYTCKLHREIINRLTY